MKRRLKKKKHLFEFTEYGIKVNIKHNEFITCDELDSIHDALLLLHNEDDNVIISMITTDVKNSNLIIEFGLKGDKNISFFNDKKLEFEKNFHSILKKHRYLSLEFSGILDLWNDEF